MKQKSPSLILAYDLGGTKVAVGVVNSKGKVLEEIRVPVATEKGKTGVIRQLGELGREFLKRHPKIRRVGMASAGPLDPETGVLLDPTNLVGKNGESWGATPIAKLLSKELKRPVYLENDAAAAILAEHWVGSARKCKNAMILTLGTGLGTGIIANGELVRSGRQLHPEAGHVILNYADRSAPCGCGNLGCAEAYLSGRNFGRRIGTRLGNPELTAKDITGLARAGNREALAAFDEYAWIMAVAIRTYAVLYAPECVVFTGSFADASDLFLKKTQQHLEKLLERRRIGKDLMPKLMLSSLNNQAGLIGGAYVAMRTTSGRD